MSEEDLKLRPGDDVIIYSTSDDKQFVEGEVSRLFQFHIIDSSIKRWCVKGLIVNPIH